MHLGVSDSLGGVSHVKGAKKICNITNLANIRQYSPILINNNINQSDWPILKMKTTLVDLASNTVARLAAALDRLRQNWSRETKID